MKTRNWKALTIAVCLLCIGSVVFGAPDRDREKDTEKDKAPKAIVPGSPHRSPELLGLPHILLGKKQIEQIELIVKNNQEGVVATQRALKRAEAELAAAKKAGRPKMIELAAFSLGQAIGDKAILDRAVVNAIKEVLTERQLKALQEFNAASQRWLTLGKLSAPEKPERDKDDDDDKGDDDKGGDGRDKE